LFFPDYEKKSFPFTTNAGKVKALEAEIEKLASEMSTKDSPK
jgi:hypothetical protein